MKVELNRDFWHELAKLYREGLIHPQCLSCDYECGADILDELVMSFPKDLNKMWDEIAGVVYRKCDYSYDLTPDINKILDKWNIA